MKKTETSKLNEAIDLAVAKAVSSVLASQQKLPISCSVDPDKVSSKISATLTKDATQILNRAVANQFKEDVKPGEVPKRMFVSPFKRNPALNYNFLSIVF